MSHQDIKIGKRYRHFKGGEYRVIAEALHSETEEEMVVYQNVNDEQKIWVRPKQMFLERVEKEGYSGPRFICIEE